MWATSSRGLFLLPILLSGCIFFATTSGSHHRLPPRGTVVVLWGTHHAAIGQATDWLQRRGLRLVERTQLLALMREQRVQLLHTPDAEADLLRVGKLVGAQQVIFLEDDGRGLSVSIRGVNVETGTVDWAGTAYWPHQPDGTEADHISRLVCHALATAWGYRPPGNDWILSSSMCEVGSGQE